MNILVIGEETNLEECRQKFGEGHSYLLSNNQRNAEKSFQPQTVIFDFLIDKNPTQIEVYRHADVVVFLNTVKVTLSQLIAGHEMSCTLFGFAGLPTFLNRELLETSLYNTKHRSKLEDICNKLTTKFQIVEDRVGLVTPRVICMIINEAYFTVEEGTASREDIDMAMRLGTNYPFGPFEWAKKIGLKNIVDALQAVYDDTKDERYKICSLLRREAIAN